MSLSVRYQILALMGALLLAALGTYLYVATELFTRDKLAYVYDVEASIVDGLSEQTEAYFNLLIDKGRVYAQEAERLGAGRPREELAKELFSDNALFRIRVMTRAGAEFRQVSSFSNTLALKDAGLTRADLRLIDSERPISLDQMTATGVAVVIQNSSLPPDIAILSIAARVPSLPGRVVVLDVGHQDLLHLFSRSEVHTTWLVNKHGEVLAHPLAARVVQDRDASSHPLVKQATTTDVERQVKEFESVDGEDWIGAYADVGVGGLTVLTEIPKREALRAARELVRRSLLFGVAILLATMIVGVFFSRRLTAPISRLRAATDAIGGGQFHVVDVDTERSDEIGDLGRAFVQMANKLEDTQKQLVQATRLATIGQIGAGITHEVRNPITGVMSLAQVARDKVDDPKKVRELLEHIEKGARRASETLNNLLKFARSDPGDYLELDVNGLVQDTAKMVQHQLNIHNVRLKVDLADGPLTVKGSPGELQQVLVNLAINAQQALKDGGHVEMRTENADPGANGEGKWVSIVVADDGPGIPKDVQTKIFEPFFTTKGAGEGTGLGLSVSHSIVQAHGGELDVDSSGDGTTFFIRLPRHQ